ERISFVTDYNSSGLRFLGKYSQNCAFRNSHWPVNSLEFELQCRDQGPRRLIWKGRCNRLRSAARGGPITRKQVSRPAHFRLQGIMRRRCFLLLMDYIKDSSSYENRGKRSKERLHAIS